MMKKKSLRFLVMLALIVCLMASTMSAPAFADFSGTYSAGQTLDRVIVYSTTYKIDSATITDGTLPDGLKLTKSTNNIYLSGSTTSIGEYSCTVSLSLSGDYETVTDTINVRVDILEAVATATPAPTATPSKDPPTITKNPTGETVEEGGTAKFVARADNATEIIWRLVSADTTNTVPAKDGPSYFSGLKVDGLGTEKLTLSNIPKSLDGWSVECRFVNENGSSFTTGAIVTVISNSATTTATPAPTASSGTVKSPVINTQPRGVNQTLGNDATLSVKAISTDGGTLSYQWYSSTENSTANLTKIDGATESSYTPPQTEGTVYYSVAVTNTLNGKTSTAIYSNLAAVTYSTNSLSTLSPLSSASPSASASPDASATPAPSATASASDGRYDGGSLTTSLVFFAITGVLALAALVVIVIFLKKNAGPGKSGKAKKSDKSDKTEE